MTIRSYTIALFRSAGVVARFGGSRSIVGERSSASQCLLVGFDVLSLQITWWQGRIPRDGGFLLFWDWGWSIKVLSGRDFDIFLSLSLTCEPSLVTRRLNYFFWKVVGIFFLVIKTVDI